MTTNEGNILRLARSYYGWSQTETARALGVSKSYLSEIESGKRPVSLKVIRKYATVFSVPASSLLFFMEVVGDTRDEAVPVKGLLQTATLKMLYWIREQFDDEQDCE